jgi:hypothetical protein
VLSTGPGLATEHPDPPRRAVPPTPHVDRVRSLNMSPYVPRGSIAIDDAFAILLQQSNPDIAAERRALDEESAKLDRLRDRARPPPITPLRGGSGRENNIKERQVQPFGPDERRRAQALKDGYARIGKMMDIEAERLRGALAEGDLTAKLINELGFDLDAPFTFWRSGFGLSAITDGLADIQSPTAAGTVSGHIILDKSTFSA